MSTMTELGMIAVEARTKRFMCPDEFCVFSSSYVSSSRPFLFSHPRVSLDFVLWRFRHTFVVRLRAAHFEPHDR